MVALKTTGSSAGQLECHFYVAHPFCAALAKRGRRFRERKFGAFNNSLQGCACSGGEHASAGPRFQIAQNTFPKLHLVRDNNVSSTWNIPQPARSHATNGARFPFMHDWFHAWLNIAWMGRAERVASFFSSTRGTGWLRSILTYRIYGGTMASQYQPKQPGEYYEGARIDG